MAQPTWECFAVTPPGVEELCAAEMRTLGIEPRVVAGGVECDVVPRDLYRLNLWSRVAARVLVRLGRFRCRDFPELHRSLLRLPWGRFIRPGRACRVRASSSESRLNHSGRIAETVLAAVSKALGGEVPAPADGGEQLIFVRFERDFCTLSVDSSGALLHQRGYRHEAVAAPLRENLAAAILLRCGYDGHRALLDPMCGSGTFAIEAALIAAGLPPGANRKFAFMDWPHFRPHVWTLCLQERGVVSAAPAPIIANDIDPQALAAARANAAAASVAERITFCQGAARDLVAPAEAGLLVWNPPYGERLGNREALLDLYHEFGAVCRGALKSWDIAWLSADPRFVRALKIGCRKIWSFSNGGIGVELRRRPGEKA